LGVQGREQERGAEEEAADGGPVVHACDGRSGGGHRVCAKCVRNMRPVSSADGKVTR
jgi:hypothetical protein